MSEKIEQFWRDATADDVARVMDGQTVEARFAISKGDWSGKEWVEFSTDGICLRLGGWSEGFWVDSDGDEYKQCQVYDPPAWYISKPDPGEGFRLLEKFPPETKLGTDEVWNWGVAKWQSIARPGEQAKRVWYRRRIANNPEIPDSCNSSETPNSCRSREDIPSGWRLLGKDEERLASDAYWSLGAKDWIVIGDDRVGVANELPKWHAIRRLGSFDLVVGFNYTLPSGKVVRVTAKGFEVL